MSEFLNVYQFTTNGELLLETDRGFKSFNPKIKMAFTVRRTISSAPSIGELLQYSDEVLEVLRHEAANRLRWTGRPIGSSESWSPTLSGQEVFGPLLKCLFDSALNRYGFTEDECNASSRNDVVRWLNKFIEWAESKVVPVLEFENGQKVDEKDVTAEFREGGKPTGTILTSTYLIESDDWYFKYPKQFTEAMSAQRLTRWIKVGRPFAYLYTELAAMNREDAMKPDV